jgi:hypothetical protein
VKGALGWVKSNLVSVIAIVIAIAAFPVLFFFSQSWSQKLNEQVESDVGGNIRDLNQISVTYEAPTLDPSQQPVSFSQVPNEATTSAIKAWIDALSEEVQRVKDLALQANDPNREPLVDGLFPEPSAPESTSKRQEMARVWPGAMANELLDAGADGPPDPMVIFDRLNSQFEVERQRLLGVDVAGTDAQLEPEDAERIHSELGEERLRLYKLHAGDTRFYATPSVIDGVRSWDETQGAPSLVQCWEWQLRYWVLDDVMRALSLANTDEAGQELSVPDAPIKRIERISIAPWDLASMVAAQTQNPPATANTSTEITRDYSISVSGRTAWPAARQNQLYDIRYVDLSLIVDARKIPHILAAFPRAGLMSVVDLSVIEDYDPKSDLSAGYYYGVAPLMRMRMRIETVWMRPWMAPLVPRDVRGLMQIPDEWAMPETEEGDEDAPAVS